MDNTFFAASPASGTRPGLMLASDWKSTENGIDHVVISRTRKRDQLCDKVREPARGVGVRQIQALDRDPADEGLRPGLFAVLRPGVTMGAKYSALWSMRDLRNGPAALCRPPASVAH